MKLVAVTLAAFVALVGAAGAHVPPPQPVPRVIVGVCPGLEDAVGCYDPATHEIYVRPFGSSRDDYEIDRLVRYHEFGHAFDATVMTSASRVAFTRAVRWARWDEEAFADWYSRCALHERPVTRFWRARYRRACRSIWSASTGT